MKTSSLLALVASFAAAVVCFDSCGGSTGGNEEPTSTFDVKDHRLISVGSEGGKIAVDYAIIGSKEGNTAEVTTSDTWIRIGKVYSTTFTVTVDPNDSGEDRTGQISMHIALI